MNIPNFKDGSGKWQQYEIVNRHTIWTVSGRVFNDMNSRCIVGGYKQKVQQTYIGCYTSENFKDFQFFTNWHMSQIGFGLDTYELDKDFIVLGNKLYSEDTCVLIPSALNTFFGDARKIRGTYPQGVVWHPQRHKFQAQIKINNKNTYLGIFKTVEEASAAYKTAKEAEAQRWHQRLIAGEFVVDKRVVERMKTWRLEC
jgi:hypothetical protein